MSLSISFSHFHSVCFSGKFEEKEKKMQPYFHLTKTALLAVAVGSCRLSQVCWILVAGNVKVLVWLKDQNVP